MKVITLFLLITLVLCTALAFAAPKAAVVYSSWGGSSFQNEFDDSIKNLNWNLEKFENVQISSLASRLTEFDVVVVTSTGNFEHTQDMTPYKSQWLGFLQKGGILLIVDANYDSVLNSWVNTFGPEFALTTVGCAPFTKNNGGSAEVKFDDTCPILMVPNDIREDFVREGGIWSHLDSWPEDWKSIITCADNKSLFLYKNVGKGLVAITSYASFQGLQSKELSEKLLNNLLLFTQSSVTGMEIVSSKFPEPVPGTQKGSVSVKNISNNTKNVVLRFSSEPQGAVVGDQTTPVRIEPGSKATIPFELNVKERGKVIITADVIADGGDPITLVRKLDIPELMTFKTRNRHYFKASEVAFVTTLAPDAGTSLKDCSLEISVDGRKVKTIKSPKAADTYKIKTSGLDLGAHKAQIKLMHQGNEIKTLSDEFVLNPEAKIHSRADGTLMIDGKPEFPFGWYTVSWGLTSQEKVDFLQSIGEAGFNAAHVSCTDANAWKTVLDAAQKYGVRVITEYGGDYPALINMYKDHPAVLAWNPGDEPDGQGISPEEMLRRANSFRDVDPNHPAYMVLCVPPTYAKYAGSADIIAPDIYPVPHGKIADVYNFLLSARTEASKHNRPIWAVVQCFGYKTPNSWRVPTVNECRNMTYQSLIAGAKGIIYYTYFDSGFNVREFPELWAGMKDLVPEINAIKPFLVSGMPTAVKTNHKDIFAGTWKNKGQHLLVVINASSTENLDVSIALPAGADKAIKPVFERDTYSLSVNGNKLTGKLKALGVAVYKY